MGLIGYYPGPLFETECVIRTSFTGNKKHYIKRNIVRLREELNITLLVSNIPERGGGAGCQ